LNGEVLPADDSHEMSLVLEGRRNNGTFAPGNTAGIGPQNPFYNPGVVGRLLARLALGVPLTQICKDKDMPAARTVNGWVRDIPEFAAAYEEARDEGHDCIAMETLEIVDKVAPDRDEVAKAKLRVAQRNHLLGVWDAKRYGPRVQADVGGTLHVTIGAAESKL
jgi:hypothetical protein